ncbi:MAG: DNA methyltransferase, partial [Steroidobacteraceae bacterium]
WHPMLTQGTFVAAAAAAAVLIHRQIIWVKPQFIFGRGDYHWQHELCFYGWRQGNRPPWYGPRNQATVWNVDWGEKRSEVGHPTAKPTALWAAPIANHTHAGEIIAEPFSGSGSQVIAAEQTGRRCFAMEIDARYVDLGVARWEAFTGKKADREARRE